MTVIGDRADARVFQLDALRLVALAAAISATVLCIGYGFYRVIDKIRSIQAQGSALAEKVARLDTNLAKAKKEITAFKSGSYPFYNDPILRNHFFASRAHSTPRGPSNVGMGQDSLKAVSSGYENTAVGDKALQSFTSGGNATAVGSRSMKSMVDPFDVTAFGARTLANATTGVGDTAIGFRSLEMATVARNNTAVGDSSLWQYQGVGSVAMGYVVGEYWRQGDHNVAVGIAAGRNRGAGSKNVLVGASTNSFPDQPVNKVSGDGGLVAGDGNVAVGYAAMLNVTGDNNTFIGRDAGNHALQKIDVASSISIGAGTYTTKDHQIVLGDENVTEIVIGGVIIPTERLRDLVSTKRPQRPRR